MASKSDRRILVTLGILSPAIIATTVAFFDLGPLVRNSMPTATSPWGYVYLYQNAYVRFYNSALTASFLTIGCALLAIVYLNLKIDWLKFLRRLALIGIPGSIIGFAFLPAAGFVPLQRIIPHVFFSGAGLTLYNLDNCCNAFELAVGPYGNGITVPVGLLAVFFLLVAGASVFLVMRGSRLARVISAFGFMAAMILGFETWYAYVFCGNFPSCIIGKPTNPLTAYPWDYWNYQVSTFQFQVGLSWLTNHELFWMSLSGLLFASGSLAFLKTKSATPHRRVE
jgi:hypothetical protein